MSNNNELKQLQAQIKKWDDKEDPLAGLDDFQIDVINNLEDLNAKFKVVCGKLFFFRKTNSFKFYCNNNLLNF